MRRCTLNPLVKLLRYFPAILQVLEICFTLFTSKVFDSPEVEPVLDPAIPVDPAADSDPVSWTSWPTCSASFEVSPDSVYVVPASLMSV